MCSCAYLLLESFPMFTTLNNENIAIVHTNDGALKITIAQMAMS